MDTLNNYCRSCGTSDDIKYIQLNGKYLNKYLIEIFYECTNIDIRGDPFSKLCKKCFDLLILFYEFRLQTQNTNSKLTEQLNVEVKEEFVHEDDDAYELESIEIKVQPFEIETLQLEDIEEYNSSNYEESLQSTSKTINKNDQNKWMGYKCVGCQETFKFVSELATHLKDMRDEKHLWVCDICSRSHRTKNQLIQHVRRLHKECECIKCGETFIGGDLLIKHNRRVHKDEKQAVCPQCGKFFLDKRGLNVHIKGVHEKQMNYSCHYCGKKAFSKINLVSHFRTHTDERPFQCDFSGCGKRFKQLCQLKAHGLSHLTEQNHSCDICGIKVKSKYYLTEHRKIHLSTEIYKCDMCDSTFARPNYLKDHKRKQHTLQIPAPCPECGKIFKSQKTLSVHMNYHKETDHICPHCNRMFARKILLNHHISATHEKNRKWICVFPNCDKAYLRCSHLRHHERVVHYSNSTDA